LPLATSPALSVDTQRLGSAGALSFSGYLQVSPAQFASLR